MTDIGEPKKEIEIEPFPQTVPEEEPRRTNPAPATPAVPTEPTTAPSKDPVPA